MNPHLLSQFISFVQANQGTAVIAWLVVVVSLMATRIALALP